MKRCVLMTVQVSTNRPDTSELERPEDVPGAAAAHAWLAEYLGKTEEEVAALETLDLKDKTFEEAHLTKLALLLGRGWRRMPALRTLDMSGCNLGPKGARFIADALKANESLRSVKCARRPPSPA